MVKLPYYNQNNYGAYKYPSPTAPNATIKTGGCGVVCVSMIVEGLTSKRFPPQISADFAIRCGARVAGGTDMRVLGAKIAEHYGLEYGTTNSETVLRHHLINGGAAIANVGGNRSGYTGVFSDGGHYVVVYLYNPNNKRVAVYDPGYYAGKYNKSGRKGKVTADGRGGSCLLSILHADCANRSPRYYLFKKKAKKEGVKMTNKNTVPTWAKKAWEWAKKEGLMDGKRPNDSITRAETAVVFHRFKNKYIK
jgi:hypothetical protein